MRRWILGFYFIFIPLSHATWFEVTSQANFVTDINKARKKALEDAVYQALIFSNAKISSLKNISHYFEKPKINYHFNGNEIRQIQIKDIQINKKNKSVKLTARIDIYPAAKTCHKQLYKKKLLLSQFNITKPQQATLGSIFKFGNNFTHVLKSRIEKESQSFFVTDITAFKISTNPRQELTHIAQKNDIQLILSGDIVDISATLDANDQQLSNRQLALNIKMFDGQSGAIIYQNNYRDIAQWAFEKSSKVDTQTARFWTSAYGKMAQNMTKNILLDLENQFSCLATKPKIIAIHDDHGQIAAGRTHGVKTGDKLTLWHNSAFIDQHGKTRRQLVKSQAKLIVSNVFETTSKFTISPPEFAASIQIGDLITKQLP